VARDSRPYRFERGALDDLRQGVLWYEDKQPDLGASFAAEVERAMAVVASGPRRWPLRNGTRRYVLRRFPYTIAYRTTDAEIIVVAIAHHRLDPGSWDKR
jgi:plasmid stabilization system protein ParE